MSSVEFQRNDDEKFNSCFEFWLISAPNEKSNEKTYNDLHNLIKNNNSGYVFKFQVPDLKVGTLDILVGLSEDLSKIDTYTEGIIKKLVQYLEEVLEEKEKIKENLTVNGVPANSYICNFKWDMAKYPYKQPLKTITDIITKNITQTENELKMKGQVYNNIKSNIQNIERKNTGSLMTRTLTDLVTKENFVLNSNYLTTLVVVVPNSFKKDWLKKYDSLTDMIVPESSKLISEDHEYCLFTVTLFKKVIDDFKFKCRENRFIVRDFEYNEDDIQTGKEEVKKLNIDKTKLEGPLIRWLKTNFSETFIAWIHIKTLRIFVESILRYGLPVNFQAMIIAPNKKQIKKLRDLLYQHYKHLDTFASSLTSQKDLSKQEDIPGFNLNSSDYFCYVFFKINVDFLNFK